MSKEWEKDAGHACTYLQYQHWGSWHRTVSFIPLQDEKKTSQNGKLLLVDHSEPSTGICIIYSTFKNLHFVLERLYLFAFYLPLKLYSEIHTTTNKFSDRNKTR